MRRRRLMQTEIASTGPVPVGRRLASTATERSGCLTRRASGDAESVVFAVVAKRSLHRRRRGGGVYNAWLQLSSLVALLCLGLMPARGARCLAADPAPPQAAAAPAAQKAVTTVRKTASGAVVITAVAPAAKNAPPARPQPAARRGSLLGAIVNALGGGGEDERRRAAEARNQQAMAANLHNLEAQFRPQFEQLLCVELAFLRRACKPDAKAFVEVAKAAKADLNVPVRQYVRAVYMPQFRGQQPAENNPRLAMQKLLTPLAEAKLGPEKARLYRQKCEKREEARKHAVVVNLVAALDERLVLTAAQRAKLVDSLLPKYDHSWDGYCQVFSFNGEYLPPVPDESVVPVLDEKQKSVWQEAVRLYGRVNFGVSINNGIQFGEAADVQEIARMVQDVEVKDDR